MDEGAGLTLFEDDLYERDVARKEDVQLIVFRISDEWYAVRIGEVLEVIWISGITYLPGAQAHIAGVVNLRGNILSVTDLKRIFGLPETDFGEKQKLVVIQSGNLETGLLVDEVKEPTDVEAAKIDPALATIEQNKAGYIEGQLRVGNRLVGILNVEKILKG